MDFWEIQRQYQRIYDARIYEEQRNWERYHDLLRILNETATSPYDGLTGNTRGRGHLREDVVRAYLVQGFNALTSMMFNFDRPWSDEVNIHEELNYTEELDGPDLD